MSARPPLHVTSSHDAAHLPSPHGNMFPPSSIPSRPKSAAASPTSSCPSATSTAATLSTPFRPKRPLSASRVQTTTVRPHTPPVVLLTPSTAARMPSPRGRPASASRVRAAYMPSTLNRRVDDESEDDDVDTIAIPMSRIPLDKPTEVVDTVDDEPILDDAPPVISQQHDDDVEQDRASLAEAEKFLRAWQCEETNFRSPLLFAEASFAQVKAMTSHGWPQPNVFLSSIAFGSLEMFCKSLERQYPFLLELVDAVGAALFSNHIDLRRSQLNLTGQYDTTASFLQYLQQGQYRFQQLRAQEDQLTLWRRAAQDAKRENQRLSEQLQKEHVARLVERVQERMKSAATTVTIKRTPKTDQRPYPQLRRMLFGGPRGACLDLVAEDYEFEPTAVEILLVFDSLRPDEATKLLSMMLAKACELQLPRLGEMYATAVDMLPESERRKFLSEYLQLIDSEELQDALRGRDETNREKEWAAFLEEMKGVLRIYDAPRNTSQQLPLDEARVSASVHDLVDLVEELAAEISLADDKKPLKLSADVVARLRPYQSLKKKSEKANQLMTAIPSTLTPIKDTTTCGCACGKHRLVHLDEPTVAIAISDHHPQVPLTLNMRPLDPVEDKTVRKKKDLRKRSSVAGKSTTKRKSSSYAVSARVSTRNSMATVRLFPLSEVCHLVSAVVQLQFARETGDSLSARRGSLRRSSRLPGGIPSDQATVHIRPSFRRLAKDLLTRKYGIKSIAVMHMLQLETSLVHFGATNKHARCELFAWFVGADKTRSHYKDLGFQFYLHVVKTVIALLLKRPLESTVSYADLIAGWTEFIGDADTAMGALPPKTISSLQCVDVCTVVFPLWMKESSAFCAMLTYLKTTTESLDLEQFFKRVMAAWEVQLIKALAQIEETFLHEADAEIEALNLPLFNKCVAACGLVLTSSQVLEHYASLMGEDEAGVAFHKAVLFVLEQKL